MSSYLSHAFQNHFPRCDTTHSRLATHKPINNQEAPLDLPICQSDRSISSIGHSSSHMTFCVLTNTLQHICIMPFTELWTIWRYKLDVPFISRAHHEDVWECAGRKWQELPESMLKENGCAFSRYMALCVLLDFLDINGTQWLICFHFPNSMGQSTGAVVPGAYQAPALVQNPVLTGSHLRTGGFQPSPLPVLGPFLVEPGEMGLALVIAQWKEKSVVENREWSSWNRSVVGGAAPLWCSRQMASSQSWNNSRVHLGIPQGPSEHATQKSCWLVSLKKEWFICFSNVAVCNHVGREMIVPNPFLAS